MPHFSTNPTKHGYKDLKEAVDENLAHYKAIQSGSSEPISLKPKMKEDASDNSSSNNKKLNFYNALLKAYRGIQNMNETIGDQKSYEEVEQRMNRVQNKIEEIKESNDE